MDSSYFSAETIVGVLVALFVAAIVALLLSALLLRLTMTWVAKFTPGYWRCLLVAFLVAMLGGGGGVAVVAALPALYGAGASGIPRVGTLLALGVVNLLPLALEVGAIWVLLRRPDGTPLSVGRAVLVAVVHMLLGLLIYGGFVAASIALLGGVPGVSR